MTRRTLMRVGIFAAGLVGGLSISQIGVPMCESEDDCLDKIAYQQCQLMRGAHNAAVKQRSDALPMAPKVAGVQDWLFMAHCEGAPMPQVSIYVPREPI